MIRIALVLLVIFMSTTASVSAGQEITAEQSKQDDADFAKLKREKPEEYKQLVILAQIALSAFGFAKPFDGVLDASTRDALRRYQSFRRLAVTGDLDAKTLDTITRDLKDWQARYILFPNLQVFVDFWDQGWVSATGTWIIAGQKSGRPVQTSKIQCDKKLAICAEATAHLDDDFLSANTEVHQIDRWDDHEIVTLPKQSATCARYTMRIGRAQRAVTGLRLRTSDAGVCAGFEAELHLQLVDGMVVTRQMIDERNKQTEGLMQVPALKK
jgi:hypothetical protein